MRRPRDIDAELRTLDEKAKRLRARKVIQLGELVIGCGADTLPIEMLAGALLAATRSQNATEREAWRVSGAGFFRGKRRNGSGDAGDKRSAASPGGPAPSAAGAGGAA